MTAMPSLSSHSSNRVQRSPDGSPHGVPLSTKNLRQSVRTKGPLQPLAHGIAALIGTSLQAKIIARMIVHHRQRMALRIIAKPHPAFEVHLP